MKARICDRCGKVMINIIKPLDYGKPLNAFHIKVFRIDNLTGTCIKDSDTKNLDYDICENCLSAFIDFMKENQNENN